MTRLTQFSDDSIAALKRDYERLRYELGNTRTMLRAFMSNVPDRNRWMIGKISGGAIASEGTGTVTRYNQLWVVTDPAETYTVLNPHEIELPDGLRVRWTRYPGWTDWVVEPFDYTEC